MIRALAVGLSACLLSAAPAGAQDTVSSYTRNAEADRPGVVGAPVVIAGPGTVLRASRTVSRLVFSARDAAGDYIDLDVGAAPGDTLQPGVFDGADRMGGTAQPTLGIGQSCQNEDARFEIRDLALDADGRPARAWILWETRCYARTVYFGEYRLNKPVGDAPAVSVPGIVRWAAGDPGHPRVDVPVRLTAVRSARVVSVEVEGRDATSFAVGSDACTGRVLAAGEPCTVSTRFLPIGSGAKLAALVVRYADGARQTVPLQGFTYGGTSRLWLDGEPGEPLTGGGTRRFGAADAGIHAVRTADGVKFRALPRNTSWQVDLSTRSGQPLAVGHYDGGLDVSGEGRGCAVNGDFTIHSLAYTRTGSIRELGATFQARCDNSDKILRGTAEWRAGENAEPAPWMGATAFTAPRAYDPTGGAPPDAPGDGTGGGDGGGGTGGGTGGGDGGGGTGGGTGGGDGGGGTGGGTGGGDGTGDDTGGGDGGGSTDGGDAAAPGGTPGGGAAAGAAAELAAGARPGGPATSPPGATPRAAEPRWSCNGLRTRTARSSRLLGSARAERLLGGGGRDRLFGRGGDDCLEGRSGADRLDGGAGDDVLRGGSGADRLVGGPGRDLLDCGGGRDVAVAGPGDRTRGCERVVRAER